MMNAATSMAQLQLQALMMQLCAQEAAMAWAQMQVMLLQLQAQAIGRVQLTKTTAAPRGWGTICR